MRYEFTFPPSALSPNARVHWRTLAKAKAQYKEECEWLVLAQGRSWWPTIHEIAPPVVTAQVTFIVTDKRRRDTDNFLAMLKPLWDALVEMGALVGDHADVLRIAEPKWERGPEKKVVVELFHDGGSDD